MALQKDLLELIKAEVITQDTANNISDYYSRKSSSSTNRLFVVFGILGAILVGLGIILIIAHNWDELSKSLKLIFAFAPLLIGQLLCLYALLKKRDSIAWKESASAFLFFAVGASISLVSQIYNIPGNLSSFLSTWMLLCLPVILLMKSSITSLLYIVGITYYAGETGYWSYPSSSAAFYWVMLLGALLHYYLLYRSKPKSNFMVFHNWMLPLSIIIALGTLAEQTEELMFVAYICIYGLFYTLGNHSFFKEQKSISNGYRFLGSMGTIVILLMLSFNWFWEDVKNEVLIAEGGIFHTPELLVSIGLFVIAAFILYLSKQHKKEFKPMSWVFIVFTFIFLGFSNVLLSVIAINIVLLILGVLTVHDGAKRNNLATLNYGLLIITAMVVCRFFDSKISFVVRGVLFVMVGVGFFTANYVLLKKRKANEVS